MPVAAVGCCEGGLIGAACWTCTECCRSKSAHAALAKPLPRLRSKLEQRGAISE